MRFDLVVVVAVVSVVAPVVIAESVEVAGSLVVGAEGVLGDIDGSVAVEPIGAPGMVDGEPVIGPVVPVEGMLPVVPVCAPPGAGAICATAAVERPRAAMVAKVAIRMGLVLFCDVTFEWVGGITAHLAFSRSFYRQI